MKNIILLSFLLTFSSCDLAHKSDDEIYLVSRNFNGRVIIFYNQKDGSPKKYLNNYRIFEIPESGILKTQFEPNYGTIANRKFMRITEDNDTLIIQNRHNTHIDTNEVQVFGITHGTSYPIIEGKKNVTMTTEYNIPFTVFIIDKYSNRRLYDFKTGFEEGEYWNNIKAKYDVK